MYPDIRLCARQITCTGADVVLQCCGEKKSELLFHENVKLSITFGNYILCSKTLVRSLVNASSYKHTLNIYVL